MIWYANPHNLEHTAVNYTWMKNAVVTVRHSRSSTGYEVAFRWKVTISHTDWKGLLFSGINKLPKELFIFFLTPNIHLHTSTMFYNPTLDTIPLREISNCATYQIFSDKINFCPAPYSSFWLMLQKEKKKKKSRHRRRNKEKSVFSLHCISSFINDFIFKIFSKEIFF